MHLLLLDLDAMMNIIWRSGGYHRQDIVDYESYFKTVHQAVRKHIRRVSPTHQAVLIADPSDNYKRSLDQSYRSDRFVLPLSGMIKVRRLIRNIEKDGYKVIVCPRSEPYDVMAYMANKLGSECDMTFMSSDKRAWGLISDKHQVYWPYAKNPVLSRITPKILAETQNGLTTEQFREMLVLSEINGIGPKKATRILKEYGSLQGASENLAAIEGSVGQILRERLKSDGRRAYRHIYPYKLRSIGVSMSDMKAPSSL